MNKLFLAAAVVAGAIAFSATGADAQQGQRQTQTQAQPVFRPGWHIVQECAEFLVIQPSGSDVQAQGAEAVEMYIAPGEIVLAFERTAAGVTYAFESHGRLSALRPARCLTPAPAPGRPAYISQQTEADGVTIASGSTVWLRRHNTRNGRAVVLLAGGREVELPTNLVRILPDTYAEEVRNGTFKTVHP